MELASKPFNDKLILENTNHIVFFVQKANYIVFCEGQQIVGVLRNNVSGTTCICCIIVLIVGSQSILLTLDL